MPLQKDEVFREKIRYFAVPRNAGEHHENLLCTLTKKMTSGSLPCGKLERSSLFSSSRKRRVALREFGDSSELKDRRHSSIAGGKK